MISRVLFLLLTSLSVSSTDAISFPFAKKKYNPVLFFKVPPGLIPECDDMEKCISEVEKELGVKVERLDAARDPSVAALLSLLTKGKNPPLLYHRESLQMISVPQKGRVRSLIKGRLLNVGVPERKGRKQKTTILVDDDAALDQQDLMEDQMLTPLQRKGKQSIRERTKEKGNSTRN
jgi:hypothetical protein